MRDTDACRSGVDLRIPSEDTSEEAAGLVDHSGGHELDQVNVRGDVGDQSLNQAMKNLESRRLSCVCLNP